MDRYLEMEIQHAHEQAPRTHRVLVYPDKNGKNMYAHDLDMDLVGYHEDGTQAIEGLRTIVTEQVAYAMEEGEPGLAKFAASDDLQLRAEKARKRS